MATAVATGYYRFTDIFFEWHSVLPDAADVHPLKATISYDALVDPNHPLRREGVDGIELYLGTFANGEMRLLFSSAQIEYVRYWLHAMQLTKKPIPIPSLEYLIPPSDMMTVSPCVFKSAAALKMSIKTTIKNNKRLKGTDSLLTARRLMFEKIRAFWALKRGTWCAVDFEAWDRDHTVLTEFGWSAIRWEEGEEVMEDGHLIVREHRGYFNHYVSQFRDNYGFGQSEDVSRKEFKERICGLLAQYRAMGPVFLVFHDNNQDIKYLRSNMVEAPITDLTFLLPDVPAQDGLYVVDTADMFAALEGDSSVNKRGLERVCRHLHIPTTFLHNAGNDAHYTLLAMKEMAAGDPLDQQRDMRWPNRTSSTNPRVEFKPWEEDSDLSDLETIMPKTWRPADAPPEFDIKQPANVAETAPAADAAPAADTVPAAA